MSIEVATASQESFQREDPSSLIAKSLLPQLAICFSKILM